MCKFYEKKFKEINRLKYLMIKSNDEESREYYKKKIKEIFKEFDNYKEDEKNINYLMKYFTIEELEEFDGENGNLAYIAINGIVYDISNIDKLKEGPHMDLKIGKDLTMVYKKCHGNNEEILRRLPMVGKLINNKSSKKEFTLHELSKYDGEELKQKYIAIDGIVYDITNIKALNDGCHKWIQPGKDLTGLFLKYHKGDKSLLKNVPVVGFLIMNKRITSDFILIKDYIE